MTAGRRPVTERPGWAGVGASASALLGAELLLARLSGLPLALADVAVALGAGGLCLALAGLLARQAAVRWVGGLLAWAVLAAVLWGILGPPARDAGRAEAVGGVSLMLLLGLMGWRWRAVRRGLEASPLPGPVGIVLLSSLAAAAAWMLELPPDRPPLPVLWMLAMLAMAGGLSLGERVWPAVLGCAVVGSLWPSSPPEPAWGHASGAVEGPDILWITVDTLRADAAAEMRSVRRLEEAGAWRRELTAASPWTLPSMASLHLGLPYSGHGTGRLPDGGFSAISDELPTLAEALAERGYDTAAVVAPNPWLVSSFGFSRGFDVFDHRREATRGALPRGRYPGSPGRPLAARLATAAGLLVAPPFGEAAEIVERGLGLWEARRRDHPLFLWIHLLDPHLPYGHADDLPLPRAERVELSQLSRRQVVGGDLHARRESVRAGYRGEVQATDQALLWLLDALGPEPPRGRIILLTSDHGEELWEHGGFEHGHSVVQEVIAVPLVVLGLPPQDLAAPWQLTPRLAGWDRSGPAPVVSSENLMHGPDPRAERAVRWRRWKLVVEPAGVRLYDLEQDPGEEVDVSSRHPGVRARLQAALGERASAPATGAVDAERGLLRELGYLE